MSASWQNHPRVEVLSLANLTVKCCQCKRSHEAWFYKCSTRMTVRKQPREISLFNSTVHPKQEQKRRSLPQTSTIASPQRQDFCSTFQRQAPGFWTLANAAPHLGNNCHALQHLHTRNEKKVNCFPQRIGIQ